LNTVVPYTFPSFVLDGSTNTGGAGELVWTVTPAQAAANPVPFNAGFDTFCIDIPESVYFGSSYNFTVTALQDSPKPTAYPAGSPFAPGPMGAAKANQMQELYNDFSAAPTSSDNDAAYQLAIWNILYDSDATVDPNAPAGTGGYQGGYFHAAAGFDPAAISTADAWLADALANPASSVTNLVALVGDPDGGGNFAQDQVFIVSSSSPIIGQISAPLPRSAPMGAMLITGMVLVGLLRSRRNGSIRHTSNAMAS
jgi:hypothetical protein